MPRQRDSQLDPAVVDAFEELQQDFIDIAGEMSERYPHREVTDVL